jgi:hypothetical protein
MVLLILPLVLACGGGDEPVAKRKPIPPKGPAKVTAPAAANAEAASKALEDGWGAVFWRNATAWKVGGGMTVVSPRATATVRQSGESLTCNGVATKGAPSHAALVLPEGASAPDVMGSPAIQAHRIERAAWRLDEVLPPRGRFDAKVSSNQPSVQRGVEVGSVSKTRRYGAPPLLIATGVRGCSGAVIITDLKAEKTLAYDRLPQTCTPLRVIPALDYDGDGNREFAVFSEERVALYRLDEKPGKLRMSRIGEWFCAIDP